MAWTGFLAGVRLTDRLALRLVLLLSVALLPLGLLAVVTSLDKGRTDRRSAERAIISLTADTMAVRRALVEGALSAGRTLARPTLERLDDPVACRDLLADTARRTAVFSFIGFIETDGIMRCASAGEPQDFSQSATFRHAMADPRPIVRRSESGAVTGQPVLIVTHPAFDEGSLRGFLSVVIPLESVQWVGTEPAEEAGVRPILFNRLGEVLGVGREETSAEGLLPAGRSLADLAREGPQVFAGRTEDGKRALFAVAELVEGQMYVLGVWDPAATPVAALDGSRWPALVPLMMWLASVVVVCFALDFLVIRHLRHLNRQMRRFALGARTPPDPLPASAPREVRDVQATFHKMAMLVTRDEAELSQALAEKDAALQEKTVLLKEVHHRVKNNLQLIASILNLQMRRLRDPRARRVLQNVQDRVLGLAAIHRSLYQSDRLSELRADRLIDELLRHLFAVGTEGGSGIDLATELDPIRLEADQLVPLSLLLTEAVTNALKYLGRPGDGGRPWVKVALRAEDGTVVLTLANSLGAPLDPGGDDPDERATRLGSELIQAFAMQLDGAFAQGAQDGPEGPHWQMRLAFRPRAAEEPAGDAAHESAPDPARDPAPVPQPVAPAAEPPRAEPLPATAPPATPERAG